MSDSYIVRKKAKIRRQEGDTGSIVFTVPDGLSLSGKAALFQVRDSSGTSIFRKSTLDSSIIIALQVITVNLDGTEGLGCDGLHNWGLKISDASNTITIGKGPYEIIKQIVRPETPELTCFKANFEITLQDVILTLTEA